ncbi:MAG: Na(+)-translocating NADH-quinone reductase subunit A [Bacteroidales bacterium]|nr:Na(+)-translocating NADH-quinone reductase subunit A [Bacteroidales bacterium]
MSDIIVLRQGLDIPVSGTPGLLVSKSMTPQTIAVEPSVRGLLPRLLVKEGDRVLCGSPVIADKKNPDILLTAPASGTVQEIVRGEKRKLLAVLIKTDDKQEYASFDTSDVKKALLASGLWTLIVQRPYGIMADPAVTPKGIFISSFSTAPLAADSAFTLGQEIASLQKGVDALASIAPVHLSLDGSKPDSPFSRLSGCTLHRFKGKHPAGNVGVQISHISPVLKGECVWTLSLQALAAIGRLFATGRLNLRRKIAVGGPAAIEPSYIEALPGTPMKELTAFWGGGTEGVRIISGDILTGKSVGTCGYLGRDDDQVTIIREGYDKELLGWINPLRFNQFSADRSYFSWLLPGHKWDMDTNLHGGPRPFLMNENYYKKVLPMDIYPVFLAKACLAGDIEKMEKFGIYEVLPEDLALCEFVDPSKNYIQDMIARGIDLMLKEMA